MLGNRAIHEKIDPKFFDFIIIDEVHRAGSETYKKILDYFKPRYVLGMSAAPERTDDPKCIYDLFDNNVLYEIRLADALDENLLCSFHYYGVSDLEWSNDERVDYIIQQSNFYGYSGTRLKGLIFVSGKDDGRILEGKSNQRGLKTAFCVGKTAPKTEKRP